MADNVNIEESIKSFLSNRKVRPESETNTFRKFLALMSENSYGPESIVHLCNSLGVQLLNDIQFIQGNKLTGGCISDAPPLFLQNNLEELLDYNDLISKLREFPSEWTVIQVSREINPNNVISLTKEHQNEDPTLLITRLPCGKLLDKFAPYCMRVPPPDNCLCEMNIMERIDELRETRRAFYNNSRDKKTKELFSSCDAGIASCLTEVETYWLREWRCLLGGRLVNNVLETEIREKISKILKGVNNKTSNDEGMTVDLLYQLIICLHHLKPREIVKALKRILYGAHSSNIAVDSEELAILMDEVKSTHNRFADSLKMAERHPVIIITEPYLELIPWEMTTILHRQPVTRILSFSLLYGLYKYHQNHIVNGYMNLSVSSAFGLINPDKSLIACEKKIGEFLQKDLPWIDVIVGQTPDPEELSSKLATTNIFMYCGHGSASQYFKLGSLKKTLVNGLVLLYGCSSNLPKGRGGRTPYQNDTYTYLTNGCPCLIGALYDITSTDADNACIKMLSHMLPKVSSTADGFIVTEPLEPNVLKAIVLGREACLKYWSKCCLVARGLPVKIVITESEKSEIINCMQK